MKQALSLFWTAVKFTYEELFILVAANLLWFFLSIPIVTMPAATAGLNLLANELAHERRVQLSLFWTGFKQYFWPALGVGAINLFLFLVLVSNFLFYAQIEARWTPWVLGLWVAVAVLWGALQLVLFPLFMEQVPNNVFLPYRNALFLVLATPVVSGTGLVLMLLTWGLSFVLVVPLVLVGGSLIAVYGNLLTVTKLQDLKALHADQPEDADEGAEEGPEDAQVANE
jgi:uncharacterized membrane protein YesL